MSDQFKFLKNLWGSLFTLGKSLTEKNKNKQTQLVLYFPFDPGNIRIKSLDSGSSDGLILKDRFWQNFKVQRVSEERASLARELRLCALSCVWLFLDPPCTPWTIPHQASLSMGFPRQEFLSGLPFSSPGDLPNPRIEPASPASQMDSFLLSYVRLPARELICKWKWKWLPPAWLFENRRNSPGWNTGVGSHFLLQGIFPTQTSNPGLQYYRWILY